MMKSIVLTAIAAMVCIAIYAQQERAAFTEVGRGAVNAFATDYHALGINPANLAYANPYNKKFTLGFFQVSASNYGEGFTRAEMMDAIQNSGQQLSFEDQFDAARRFADAAVALDASVLGLGFAINTEKAGHFAFSVGARVSHFSRFNETASNHLWKGFVDPYFDQWLVPADGGGVEFVPNGGANSPLVNDVILGASSNPQALSSLYDGTVARTMAFTEYQLGYGRTILEKDDFILHGGVGIKYLQGLFVLDVAIQDQELTRAYMAYTPALDIDFGAASLQNPSALSGSQLKPVGGGWGFDLGLAMEISEKFRVSASITDIGSITFDGNVYTARDTLLFDIETTGIDNFDITNQFDVFTGEQGLFNWQGRERQKIGLPTQFRLGFGYQHNEKFAFGLDLALPFNEEPGNIEKMGFAAGVDYAPSSTLRLSSGIAAGDNYGFRVPFGINFSVGDGAWEFGVATRDLLFYLRDDRPNISIAMGFLRFRFGTWQRLPQRKSFE